MPISPIIIPLIVAGAMLGSLLVSGKRKIPKKKLLGASILAGLLNAANAYVVYLLFPPTSYRRFGGGSFSGGSFSGGSSSFTFTGAYRGAGAGATSLTSFLLLSFLTGLLIMIVVVGAALVYVRYKGGHLEEETGEPKEEEQEELEESNKEEQEEI
jgi:hypothetical protein